jgi:4-hydroxyphenylpyruvate dioxygenase
MHAAPSGHPAAASDCNPAGTDGFEFVEFAHPQPERLAHLFRCMGFVEVAQHRRRAISVFRQGGINFVLNADPQGPAARFRAGHGPCAASMAFRVRDAGHALRRALAHGATRYLGEDRTLDVPAILGIGGSLIYLVEAGPAAASPYARDFDWLAETDPAPAGLGFHTLDHLTHNVQRGNLARWCRFYGDIFGFRPIRSFDIEGRHTGLVSHALVSPCGKIRIPINESSDEHSQVEEYLRSYNGEGIQHIALATDDLYDATDGLYARGIRFMPPPPPAYYPRTLTRVPGHCEPLERMRRHGILIDGDGVDAQGTSRILLQVFSQTVVGPIFFEFIQRKGDQGFGEGNFKALFESMEADQIRRGVLAPAAAVQEY